MYPVARLFRSQTQPLLLGGKTVSVGATQSDYTVEEAWSTISAQNVPNLEPTDDDPFGQESWRL
jgi:hypothetical protein